MPRQHYCWKISLTYSCGCVETTPTTHRCGPSRTGCSSWMSHKTTNKACVAHRRLDGGGLLSASDSLTPPSSSSSCFSSDSVLMLSEGEDGMVGMEGFEGGEGVGNGEGQLGGRRVVRAEGVQVEGAGREGCYARRRA